MTRSIISSSIRTALPFLGSAFLLYACTSSGKEPEYENNEGLITQQSDTLVMISSENGVKSYRFETPLMERYELAREPYMEFRRGIDVITYDSLGNVESTLIADYAINYEVRQLWEAKGNVVATNAKGHILETQQLFWNQKTGKIYSNIDSKVTQGDDVLYVTSFESDEQFQEWELRGGRGKMWVNVEPTRPSDEDESPQPAPQQQASGQSAPARDNNSPPAGREQNMQLQEVAPTDVRQAGVPERTITRPPESQPPAEQVSSPRQYTPTE